MYGPIKQAHTHTHNIIYPADPNQKLFYGNLFIFTKTFIYYTIINPYPPADLPPNHPCLIIPSPKRKFRNIGTCGHVTFPNANCITMLKVRQFVCFFYFPNQGAESEFNASNQVKYWQLIVPYKSTF